MKKIIYIFFLSIIILSAPLAFAKEGSGGNENENRQEDKKEQEDRRKVEDRKENENRLRIEQRIERDDNRVRIKIEEKRENEIEIKDEQEEVEIKGNNFEIRGEIIKVEKDSFIVASQTIFIDPSLVRNFEQRSILKVGERVKVEGIIIDGKKFAREIKVFRNDQQVEIEVKNATETARAKVEVKSRGPVDQIINLLRQLISLLTGQKN